MSKPEGKTQSIWLDQQLSSWIQRRLEQFKDKTTISEYFRLLASLDRQHDLFSLVKEYGEATGRIIAGTELKQAQGLNERWQAERSQRIQAEARLAELERTMRSQGRIKVYYYVPDFDYRNYQCPGCHVPIQIPEPEYFKFWRESSHPPAIKPTVQPGPSSSDSDYGSSRGVIER